MDKPRLLITTKRFGEFSRAPIERLEDAGFTVVEKGYDIDFHDLKTLTEDEMCQLIQGFDVLIVTGIFPVTARMIEKADRLKMIANRSAGYNVIALEAARQKGVLVTYNPGANADSVADMAVGLMLTVLKKIALMDRKVRNGGWERMKTQDLYKKTLGIIGLGNIGKKVAKRVQGFDMTIIANDIVEYKEFLEAYHIESVSKEELMKRADIVTIHTPLDDSTRGMIGEKFLRLMKKTSILINTARGPIIDEKALYKALKKGWIAGTGLDVHTAEPPAFPPLVKLDNLVSTCHVAGSSNDASYNMAMQTVDKIITYFKGGMPESVLTPGVTFPGKPML